MREELGLARLAEEPVLVLPSFACDLGLTVGTEGCQLHPKTPFTVISNESHPSIHIPIAIPLPEHVIPYISAGYANIGDSFQTLLGKFLPIFSSCPLFVGGG